MNRLRKSYLTGGKVISARSPARRLASRPLLIGRSGAVPKRIGPAVIAAVAGLLLAAGGAAAASLSERSHELTTTGASVPATTTPVSVSGKVETSSERGPLDTLVAWVQIVGGLVAVGSLGFIALQVKLSTEQSRQERTAQLQAVWDEREFRAIVTRALAFLVVRDAADCVDKIRAWSRIANTEAGRLPGDLHRDEAPGEQRPLASQNDVFHVVGFFEDVSLRYNEQQLDARWVSLGIGPGLLEMLQLGLWFVYFLRYGSTKPDELVLREWVETVKDLCAARQKKWQKPDHPVFTELRNTIANEQPIRAICLPGGELEEASDPDWALARRATEVLADERARSALRARPAAPARPDPSCRVILVPSRIDATAEQLAADRAEVAELDNRLAWLDGTVLDELVAPAQ